MSTIYIETSAVLSWLFNEPDAIEVANRVEQSDVILSSVLTEIETERAFIRAEKIGLLKPADVERLRGIFAQGKATWTLMEISAKVRGRAKESFPHEPVRTLDAIHLATALIFLEVFPDLTVLSFDKRIKVNTIELGIS